MSESKQLLFWLFTLFFIGEIAAQTYSPNHTYAVEELREDFGMLRTALEKAHPATYWYSSKDSMDRYFDEAYRQIDHEMTEREFYRLILPVLVQVRCGHTYPEMSKAYYESDRAESEYLPFELFLDGERLFIVKNGSDDSTLAQGDEILKLNNINVAEIARRARNLQTADGNNESWKNKFVSLFYFEEVYMEYYGGKSPFPITVLDGKGVLRETTVAKPVKMTVAVKPEPTLSAKQLYKQEREKAEAETAGLIKFRLTSLDSGAAILKIKGFSYERAYGVSYYKKHKAIFETIAERKIDHLVIDLRGNTGGNLNIVEDLMRYLVDKPFKTIEKSELRIDDINYLKTLSGYFEKRPRGYGFNWKDMREEGDHMYSFKYSRKKLVTPYTKNHFDGEVFIITDGWVFSAGSIFVSSLKSARKVYIVGEETGGGAVGCSGGRISRLVLPNTQLRVLFPHFRIYAVTQAKADGHGIIPDYIVKPTLSDVANKRDPEMKKVFELIKSPLN
jgi:hypothetical protein